MILRKRVYVAGSYSADNVIDLQRNMRRGLDLAIEVMEAGYSPYAPWLDFTLGLVAPVTLDEYKAMSMSWLAAAEAMIVVPGSENSKGTQAEIEYAIAHDIPVYYSISALVSGLTIGRILRGE